MKERESNSFGGGLNTDLGYMSVPNDVYIDALNATMTTHNGNEFILQTMRGNTYRSKLKDGYYAIGAISDGNVAYILSHNPEINSGEIGSFPAPDYSTTTVVSDNTVEGDMIMEYRPFRNYTIRNPRIPFHNTEFNTGAFNFSLDNPADMEIQKDYDGTVNIIFTDNRNPVRIINSYFKVESRNKFRIIDRVGENDTNIYNEDSFSSNINLITRTSTIAKVKFLGTPQGSGKVACGDYTYFFRYTDADGNVSDVIAQSSKVSVFIGTDPKEIRGGVPNEPSNKTVIFNLSNLDPAFEKIQVSFVYKGAQTGSPFIPRAFTIDKEYAISVESNSVRIAHSGFENTNEIDINTLNVDFTPISKAKTIAQVQGRLMIGNVVLKTFDNDIFKEFASKVRVSSDPPERDLVNSDNSLGLGRIDPTGVFNLKRSGEGRDLGYWSEFNIYDRLGYWDGEIYQFGMVFITNEGFTTSVFPVEATIGDTYTGTLNESNNYFDPITGYNKKGALLTKGKDLDSISEDGFFVNQILARSVDFKYLGDEELFDKVVARSKGYFFVRAEREKLCEAEGYLLPCVKHPNIYPDNEDVDESSFENAPGNNNSAPNSGNHYFPLMLGHLEADFALNGFTDSYRACPIHHLMSNDAINYDNSMHGVFIPDMDAGNILPDSFNGRSKTILLDTYVDMIDGDQFSRNKKEQQLFITGRETPISESDPYFNTPTSYSTYSQSVITSNDYRNDVIGDVRTTFVSREDEASNEKFYSVLKGGANKGKIRYHMRSESYIGVNSTEESGTFPAFTGSLVNSVTQKINDIPDSTTTVEILLKYGEKIHPNSPVYMSKNLSFERKTYRGAIRVRFYNSNDPWNISNLKDRYENIEGVTYFPISEREEWKAFDDVEQALTNTELVPTIDPVSGFPTLVSPFPYKCFGGDCYKQLSFKRLFWSNPYDLKPIDTFIYKDPTDNGLIPDTSSEGLVNGMPRPIGILASLLTSNNHNMYLRDEQRFDTNESAAYGRDRFFFPYSVANTSSNNLLKVLAIRKGEFKLGETNEYNSGYSSNPSDKAYFGLSNSPFTETRYDTRIYYSQIHVNNQFLNGLRIFQGLNYQDYPRKAGEIVKLLNINNSLVMIQESGVAKLGVNDRTMVGSDTAGSIFIDQAGVLHPKAGYLSESLGSRWFNSVKATSNTIYGVDAEQTKIWMITSEGLVRLSDFKVESYLRQVLPSYRNVPTIIGQRDIVTLYDPLRKDVIFTGYGDTPFTLIFNEDSQKWVTKSTMNPYIGTQVEGSLITMGLDEYTKIWQHDISSDLCKFYNKQGTFEIEFTVRGNITVQKIYDNLKLISNPTLPIKAKYSNDKGVVEATLIPRTNKNIFSHNIQYKEDHVYIEVNKFGKQRVRDKYCNIRLIYTGEDMVFIQAVLSTFRYSYS